MGTVTHGVILAKYNQRAEAVSSLLCVGLDSELEKLPACFREAQFPQFAFNQWVIDQTIEYAAAYKPNMAFYEARGSQGLNELRMTLDYLHANHPDVVTICDAKRADIGNTNRGYVSSIFDFLGFDAITLHPYLGGEALAPFLERSDKACVILCRTSNPGAREFQDLEVNGQPLWKVVAEKVSASWNSRGNCMLVVGATYPDEMQRIRQVAPDVTFLVPGIGAQGGDLEAVVSAGLDRQGKGLMIASSRDIIFSDSPARAARELRDQINAAREAIHVAH